jgi:hypothetical protein
MGSERKGQGRDGKNNNGYDERTKTQQNKTPARK